MKRSGRSLACGSMLFISVVRSRQPAVPQDGAETGSAKQSDGSPLSPDNLSRDWRRIVRAHGLPLIIFHAFRHSSASALIAAGLDVGAPCGSTPINSQHPTRTDAAAAIERALKGA